MSEALPLSVVYDMMRRDMHEMSDRMWRIRTWATTLAAAVALAVVGANFYGRLAPARDPQLFSALVLSAGALGNFALWHLSLNIDRSILRVACYVWWIEHEAKMDKGWEHWAFYRAVEFPAPIVYRVTSEIQVWIAFAYSAGLFYLWLTAAHFSTLLLVFWITGLILTMVGGTRRALGYRARRRSLKEFVAHVDEDWHTHVRDNVSE